MDRKKLFVVLCLLAAVSMLTANVSAADSAAKQIPDPDGKPADMSKPVQVYILLGQSNMVGAGNVKAGKKGGEGSLENAVKEKGLYPYLVDDAGNWTVRNDVRNVRVMGSGGPGKTRQFNNEFMTIKGGKIGPEYGIGYVMGHVTDAPVMILKSCIGNRSLGWDLLPPGSERYEAQVKDKKTGETKTYVFAGFGDSPDKWEKGTEPKRITWTAGCQYAGDIDRAKKVLAELDKYYPGAKGYEIAGFFFWQGDKDRYNEIHASRYEKNLVALINALRKDFNAPKAKFVCATLGQTKMGAEGNEGMILNAQMAVCGKSGKYPQFKGNVATVYTNPLSKGGASNGHYSGNAETYMNIGEAMGCAMAQLVAPNQCAAAGCCAAPPKK
ncbi:MAG: sialate O-acetylesterase [Phycisphaerae bacterium]|nr:sialate O-acetylesterase [Phycisphaerae bacterium]